MIQPRDLLGIPFERGADGPATVDCWGLVVLGLRLIHGVEVELAPRAREFVDGGDVSGVVGPGTPWRQIAVSNARPGDVLEIAGGGMGVHVALVMPRRRMLHVRAGRESCMEAYDRRPWPQLIRAAWRHEALA